jgi:hypothetical protein
VGDFRQLEIYVTEPLTPGPSRLEVAIPIKKFKKCKSPASDQILTEYEYYCLRSTNSLILFGIRKNCLISERSLLFYLHKKGEKTDCNYYRGISLLSASYKILSNILLSRLSPYIDEIIEDHQCGFRCNR